MEAIVEPEEVGVAAEDGGVGCVLEDVVVGGGLVGGGRLLWGGSDVDSVGGVFVHSFRVLDWVGNLPLILYC